MNSYSILITNFLLGKKSKKISALTKIMKNNYTKLLTWNLKILIKLDIKITKNN